MSLQFRSYFWIAVERKCNRYCPWLPGPTQKSLIPSSYPSFYGKINPRVKCFLGKRDLSKRRLCVWGTILKLPPAPCILEREKQFLGYSLSYWFTLPKYHNLFCTPFYYCIWSQGPCVAWPALFYLQAYSISSLTGLGSCRRKWSCGLGVWPEH